MINTETTEYSCEYCLDGGYLDHNVYCDCAAGIHMETVEELRLQVLHEELDIGLETNEDSFIEEFLNLEWLSYLPFRCFEDNKDSAANTLSISYETMSDCFSCDSDNTTQPFCPRHGDLYYE